MAGKGITIPLYPDVDCENDDVKSNNYMMCEKLNDYATQCPSITGHDLNFYAQQATECIKQMQHHNVDKDQYNQTRAYLAGKGITIPLYPDVDCEHDDVKSNSYEMCRKLNDYATQCPSISGHDLNFYAQQARSCLKDWPEKTDKDQYNMMKDLLASNGIDLPLYPSVLCTDNYADTAISNFQNCQRLLQTTQQCPAVTSKPLQYYADQAEKCLENQAKTPKDQYNGTRAYLQTQGINIRAYPDVVCDEPSLYAPNLCNKIDRVIQQCNLSEDKSKIIYQEFKDRCMKSWSMLPYESTTTTNTEDITTWKNFEQAQSYFRQKGYNWPTESVESQNPTVVANRCKEIADTFVYTPVFNTWSFPLGEQNLQAKVDWHKLNCSSVYPVSQKPTPITDRTPTNQPEGPVDCVMEEWGKWSDCRGDDTQIRYRRVMTPARNGGSCDPVKYPTEQVRVGVDCQPQDCLVGQWEDWDKVACDPSTGSKTRTRPKLQDAKYGGSCPPLTETQRFEECVPLDCVMEDWRDDMWGNCQSDGTKTRTRRVWRQPSRGGKECGPTTETKAFDECKILDCVPEEWGPWSECVYTNALNEKYRKRSRNIIPAQNGGKCSLSDTETDFDSCRPVDCMTSDWSGWSPCDASGKRVMTRNILEPARNGGKCVTQIEDYPEDCKPLNCIMGPWSDWSDCVYLDADGNPYRKQTRMELQKQRGTGQPCADPRTENREVCTPKDGDCKVSAWGKWSVCDENKSQTRVRSITQYPFNNGIRDGLECPALQETRTATNLDCILPSVCQTIASIQPMGAASMFSSYGCDTLLNCSSSPPSMSTCMWRDPSDQTPVDTKRMCDALIAQNTNASLTLAAAAGCILPPPPPPPVLSAAEIAAGNNIVSADYLDDSRYQYFTVTITSALTRNNVNIQDNIGKKIRVWYLDYKKYGMSPPIVRPMALGFSSNWVFPPSVSVGRLYAYNDAATSLETWSPVSLGLSRMDQDVLSTATWSAVADIVNNRITPIKVSMIINQVADVLTGSVTF